MAEKYAWSDGLSVGLIATAVVAGAAGLSAAVLPESILASGGFMAPTVEDTLHGVSGLALVAMFACSMGLTGCMVSHVVRLWKHRNEFPLAIALAVVSALIFTAISSLGVHAAWDLIQGKAFDFASIPSWVIWTSALMFASAKSSAMGVVSAVRRVAKIEATEDDKDELDAAADRDAKQQVIKALFAQGGARVAGAGTLAALAALGMLSPAELAAAQALHGDEGRSVERTAGDLQPAKIDVMEDPQQPNPRTGRKGPYKPEAAQRAMELKRQGVGGFRAITKIMHQEGYDVSREGVRIWIKDVQPSEDPAPAVA